MDANLFGNHTILPSLDRKDNTLARTYDRSEFKEKETSLASPGVLLGIGLLVVVTFVAIALARKAAASVAHFRDEHHERFTGRDAE
jgi:hypothetical protein